MSTRSSPLERSRHAEIWQPNRTLNKWVQGTVVGVFGLFALVSVLTTFGIVITLVVDAIPFFQEVPISNFLFDTEWTPLFTNKQYGIFVLICATFLTSAIAIAVALPLGLLSAICLSEYAPRRMRRWLKPALEILAGVPTVVYGYFALLFVTPILQKIIPGIEPFNSLSAGIVMGIAILPMVASLSEDAIYAVPSSLRQGAYALGATKREVITGVVIPGALSGIVASFILAISRAVGETMIVTIAAGQSPNLTLNPLVPVATMTSFIVQVSLGDAPAGSLAFKAIYAVGLTLFVITLGLNVFSFWFVRRFQQKYE
ncbi:MULTISPECIES: phosphate ABC transporter permease subunit PstC [unclassified Coleofasciculus]|uniref:phosphate ABC transporter permease subunit PstC n=1 Tax=unclassified Coleofasciculus TaxID=2692782 RepID=UPI00187F62A2|nr:MULTISPECIES: phosphate ABC transporter permease subunit PstC [unclassified Coleofasciculus]MBE9129817.1 phosphate ABC transporter permease subunit PstC [Coleofasciculus sp. LEGE 07081]MBE9152280.1 phosphate ABC transporter permease subunit PstC [Coleofasciculus sp. LEGE 07092]